MDAIFYSQRERNNMMLRERLGRCMVVLSSIAYHGGSIYKNEVNTGLDDVEGREQPA